MKLKKKIKILLRSGSLRFTREYSSESGVGELCSYRWNGNIVYFRPGSSDAELLYKILLYPREKSEYWVPESIVPGVIFDIGANIGIAAIYFAKLFPDSRIYSFEPVPGNFDILKKNTAPYPNISAYRMALGKKDSRMKMSGSDSAVNLGGYSFHRLGVNEEVKVEVDVRSPSSIMKELKVGKIDLIKVDTEGSEYDILTAIDPEILSSVKWITGELHGIRDFELLGYLAEWFDISAKKSLKKRLFNFSACNKKLRR
jgi:FkbM family methyltransferase